MKIIPKSKDSIALTVTTFITLGLFIAGLCDVLDYFIVEVLLFLSFASLFAVAVSYAFKNHKKNRPEDKLQDDLH